MLFESTFEMMSNRFLMTLFAMMGSAIFVTAGVIVLLLIALFRQVSTFFSTGQTTGIQLRLRGLSLNSEPDQSIESTMDALKKNGLNEPGAQFLISRLNWWNQMNRLMKSLPESLDRVVNSLEVLLCHYQLDQAEVEKDLARVIFDKALQDPNNSHLYAQLCQRLMESQIDWTSYFIYRLFQLVVDEFNRPLVVPINAGESKSNNTDVVKLMAALLKRKISEVPDNWITDFADCLIQRMTENLDNSSTEHLCLFLKTILINECDDDCNLLPSQQNQLLPCFQALQAAALNNRKSDNIKEEDTSDSEDSSTDTESETDTDSESEPEE